MVFKTLGLRPTYVCASEKSEIVEPVIQNQNNAECHLLRTCPNLTTVSVYRSIYEGGFHYMSCLILNKTVIKLWYPQTSVLYCRSTLFFSTSNFERVALEGDFYFGQY